MPPVENQDLGAERRLSSLVLQEPFDSDRVGKPTFCSLFHGAHCRGNGEYFMLGLDESTPEFLKCRRFAGSRGAAYVHSPVARVKYELDNNLLLGSQTIRDHEVVVSSQTFKPAHAAIDASDHFPLTLEAGRRRDFITVSENRP